MPAEGFTLIAQQTEFGIGQLNCDTLTRANENPMTWTWDERHQSSLKILGLRKRRNRKHFVYLAGCQRSNWFSNEFVLASVRIDPLTHGAPGRRFTTLPPAMNARLEELFHSSVEKRSLVVPCVSGSVREQILLIIIFASPWVGLEPLTHRAGGRRTLCNWATSACTERSKLRDVACRGGGLPTTIAATKSSDPEHAHL